MPETSPDGAATGRLVSGLQEPPPQEYLDAVGKIQGHINAGNVYQVNLARQWLGTLEAGCKPLTFIGRSGLPTRRLLPVWPLGGLGRDQFLARTAGEQA